MSPHDRERLTKIQGEIFPDEKEARLQSSTSNFLATNAPYPFKKSVTKYHKKIVA